MQLIVLGNKDTIEATKVCWTKHEQHPSTIKHFQHTLEKWDQKIFSMITYFKIFLISQAVIK